MRLFKYTYLLAPARSRTDSKREETHGSQDRRPRPARRPDFPRYGLVSQTLLGPGLNSRAGQTAMQAAPWQVRVGLGVQLRLGPREALRPQLAVNLIQVRSPLLGLHLAG